MPIWSRATPDMSYLGGIWIREPSAPNWRLVLDGAKSNSVTLFSRHGEPSTIHDSTAAIDLDAETTLGSSSDVVIAASNHNAEVATIPAVVEVKISDLAAPPHTPDIRDLGGGQAGGIVRVA